MLHEPETYACLGKMTGSDYRYASLKAASRGHTRIWIRRTNTKEVREFQGSIQHLDVPKEVKRGDRTITYTRRPVVKFVSKWMWNDAKNDEDSDIVKDQIPVIKVAVVSASASAPAPPEKKEKTATPEASTKKRRRTKVVIPVEVTV